MNLSFDGKGLNGPDEYRTRVATFTNGAAAIAWGQRIVTACNAHNELVAALRKIASGDFTEAEQERIATLALAKVKP
jgi:hypothetical protein